MAVIGKIVFVTVVPALVAIAVTTLARVFNNKGDERGAARWWAALAVGLAYVVGHFAAAWPSVPPIEVTDRLPWLALLATAAALAEAGFTPGRWARLALRTVLLLVALGVVLGPVIGAGEFDRDLAVRLAGASAVTLLFLLNIHSLDRPERASDLVLSLGLTTTGAALGLVLSGSAVLGQLAGVLAIGLGAAWLASGLRLIPGNLTVTSTLLAALVVEGFIYASLPASTGLLLAAAPASLWLTRVGPVQRLSPAFRRLLVAILTLIPVGLALALAVSESPSYDY